MTIEPSSAQGAMLAQLNQLAGIASDTQTISANPANASDSVGGAFMAALNHVNQLQNDSADQMKAVELGTSDDLVGTMLTSQKASLSFSTLVQVRNKLQTGFDDIMNMSL